MNKAAFLINVHFLKKTGNVEYDLLKCPRRASLKGLSSALLILTREQPFSSINVLNLCLLILAEMNISK